MLLFLGILLLKFFGFEEEFETVKAMMEKGISFEEIQSIVQEKWDELHDKTQELSIENLKEEAPAEITIENQIEKAYIEPTPHPSKEEEKGEMTNEEKIKQEYSIEAPLKGVITSAFGPRASDNPIISSYHTGIDIAGEMGESILSAHEGTVIQVGSNGSYGNSVTIASGELTTLYGHCSETNVVLGEHVSKGQMIAKVGMTGNATGPHLHFEVKYEKTLVDPQKVL